MAEGGDAGGQATVPPEYLLGDKALYMAAAAAFQGLLFADGAD